MTISSVGRRTIFPDPAALAAGVHALLRGAGATLVLFSIVDDHVHIVIYTDEPGSIAGSVLRALRAVTDVELERAHRRPVESRRHLEWLADRYILEQHEKHGLQGHPALWQGSCFLDLAGARRIPGLALQLRKLLPRYRLRTAFAAVGLPPCPLTPYTDEQLRRAGATRIARAALAALGTTHFRGKGALENAARATAAELAAAAGISSADLALATNIRPASARRLMRRRHSSESCHAARLWLALEDLALSPWVAPDSRQHGA